MLSPAQVAAVRTLRDRGMSYRQIAKRLGLARGSVAAVCLRRHPLDRGRQPTGFVMGRSRRPDLGDCPGHRCKGCGSWIVTAECLYCWLGEDYAKLGTLGD